MIINIIKKLYEVVWNKKWKIYLLIIDIKI